MPITNLNIYFAVAEEAAFESMRLYEQGRTPRPGGSGHIITFDPDSKSFKQSFIAIAFAGMYLEALLGLACTDRLGKDLYKKIERQTTYEEKLKLLGVLDPVVLDRCKRFREARNDLMHEKALHLENLGTAIFRGAQAEAKLAIEFIRSIEGMLLPTKKIPDVSQPHAVGCQLTQSFRQECPMPVDTNRLRAAISQSPPPFSLNKIGHVVLMVEDLERSIAFYTGVLGFKVSDIYRDDMMPGGMVFMRCNADHHGVALIGGASGTHGPENKRGLHHMAFEVSTLDEVFRAREFLRKSGATIVFEGRRRAGVQIAVEFLDPDGHNLEIYWGLDQIGTDGRARPGNEWHGAKSLEEAIANPPPGQTPIIHDKSLILNNKI